MLAAFAGGLAEGAALGQGGVELADVLGGGDDEDAVSHAEHGGDALVDDGLGQRADGADFVVDVGGGGSSCPARSRPRAWRIGRR